MAVNKVECRNALLSYSFCLRDLSLYLNSHPEDKVALREFQMCRDEFFRLKKLYLAAGGQWTIADETRDDCWAWVDGPWPWEYAFNKGGN